MDRGPRECATEGWSVSVSALSSMAPSGGRFYGEIVLRRTFQTRFAHVYQNTEYAG